MRIPFTQHLYKSVVVILIAILLTTVFSYIFLLEMTRQGFLPMIADEFLYFMDARSFVENGSLKDALIYEETVSQIGGYFGHGCAYTLFHGIIMQVTGMRPFNMVFINVLLVGLGVVIIRCSKLFNLPEKLLFMIVLLGYFTVPEYVFSYMQEAIQIPIAVSSTLLLCMIYRNPSRCLVMWYIALVCVASFFRQFWVLWLVGLMPLAQSFRQFLVYTAIAVAGLAFSFVYHRYFTAYPYWFLTGVLSKSPTVLQLIRSVAMRFEQNIVNYFLREYSGVYFASKYLVASATAYCLFVGVYRRRRFLLGAGLIGLAYLMLLMAVYDTIFRRDIRMLSVLVFLYAGALLAERQRLACCVLCVCIIVMFPGTLRLSMKQIGYHLQSAAHVSKDANKISAFSSIADVVTNRSMITVLLSRDFVQYFQPDLLYLPLRGGCGGQMRYTFNLGTDRPRKPAFVSYALYQRPVVDARYVLLTSNAYFHLYQVMSDKTTQ